MSDLLVAERMSGLLTQVLTEPPAWTRLEPRSVSGDPTPGLEARLHDPLWLLARQWQFGEFEGEDAGTPLSVQARVKATRITAWQPGDPAAGHPVRPLPPGMPLDPLVEAEPAAPGGPGLRQRAEGGSLLATAFEEAGWPEGRAALLAAYPLDIAARADALPEAVPEALAVPRLFATLGRGCADGMAAAAALAAGEPGWLAAAPEAAKAAAAEWLAWWRMAVMPGGPGGATGEAWIPHRLEHRFQVGLGDGTALRAPLHDGGAIDWYSFDASATPLAGAPAEAAEERTISVLASPLRYAGMPADRLWQFEDGAVNLGALEAQPTDLARLCFVEFGMVYGSDWFSVPVDAECGSLNRIETLTTTDTFGEHTLVNPAPEGPEGARFRLFALDAEAGAAPPRGMLVPPALRGTLEGRALEEVLFLRDEAANMAWAVERTVQAPGGDPRPRADEAQAPPPSRTPRAGTELRYLLQTTVPRHWIPLVPVAKPGNAGGFDLRKGTMSGGRDWLGRLLDPTPFTLQEEEVPREGLRVARVPCMARAADGQVLRWVARRVGLGRGEGSSGLDFDATTTG